MLYLDLRPTVSQRERLRRRLPILSPDHLPELGLVQVEDRYVERNRARTVRLLTIYLLLTGPAQGEFFKVC